MMNFKRICATAAQHAIPRRIASIAFCLVQSLSVGGCASQPIDYVPDLPKAAPKSLFVFMDGTGNTEKVPTNIHRLFEAITKHNDGKTISRYIQGVGNASDPIGALSGQAAGFGMEANILLGYKFLIHHYEPGDHIYIFGFSRGAHTARSLAGLIAYAGIPKIYSGQDENFWDDINPLTGGYAFGNKILEETKKELDINHVKDWQKWVPGSAPIMTDILKRKIKDLRDVTMQSAEIEFLGVWDTVPGSQGIDYFEKNHVVCKQDKVSTDHKERYKIDSYPPIHHIAHAVSLNEMREEFTPLFLCSKTINKDSVHDEKLTKLDEVVFPGAHANVGGGYGHKNNQLPDISLKWMVEQLRSHYTTPELHGYINRSTRPNPEGLADLSVSTLISAPLFTDKYFPCRGRDFPDNIVFHESIKVRNESGVVPWLYYDVKPKVGSPSRSCKDKIGPSDWNDKTDGAEEENVLCIEQSQVTCETLGYPSK